MTFALSDKILSQSASSRTYFLNLLFTIQKYHKSNQKNITMSNFNAYSESNTPHLQNDPNSFQKALRKRWIKSIIRWILTLILYIVFWNTAWIRWSLLLVLPMALINLGYLLKAPSLFKLKKLL